MLLCKLYCQLRLAYPTKATQYVCLLALAQVLSQLRQQHTFKLCYLCQPVYKLTRFRDALKAKASFVFSKVQIHFSYRLKTKTSLTLTLSAGDAAYTRLYLLVHLLRANVLLRCCRYLLNLCCLLQPNVLQPLRYVKLVVLLCTVQQPLLALELLRCLLCFCSYRCQRLTNVKDVVFKRLKRRHPCSN